jgi:dTDP-4-dehydrorhamnose 3,5-epimerase
MSVHLPRIIAPKRHVDARGWFSETFHEQRLCGVGVTCRFVQDNQSSSKRLGTLRGLHFQLPPAVQAKLVSVLRGRILDVAVDLRRGSPSYSKHVATEISAESGRQLYIPIGFAHGFLTLEDNVVIMYKVSMYKVSDYYAPALDSGKSHAQMKAWARPSIHYSHSRACRSHRRASLIRISCDPF